MNGQLSTGDDPLLRFMTLKLPEDGHYPEVPTEVRAAAVPPNRCKCRVTVSKRTIILARSPECGLWGLILSNHGDVKNGNFPPAF